MSNPNSSSPNPRCACGECGTFVACFTDSNLRSGVDSGPATPEGEGAAISKETLWGTPDPVQLVLPFSNDARALHLSVLRDITKERERQDAKWGEQNHPSVTESPTRAEAAWIARVACDEAAKVGKLTWEHIALEEFHEALEQGAASDDVKLREELVQCAAVFVAWIECLDRKAAK